MAAFQVITEAISVHFARSLPGTVIVDGTQGNDFEVLEIAFPEDANEQRRLIANILSARQNQRLSAERLSQELLNFSDGIDGRGAEELPEIDATPAEDGEESGNSQ
jgi:hypothetical protein